MKQISTGTGLVVLSGTILASVFLSSPRTASTAFASAQQAQPAERGVGRNLGSNATMVADCQSTESLQWFSNTPKEIQGCLVLTKSGLMRFGSGYSFDADMNSDGFDEYLFAQTTFTDGFPQYSIYLSTMETVAGVATSKLVFLCSFTSQSIDDYRSSVGLPLAGGPGWLMEGLRDCDNDGDLDLVISSSAFYEEASYMYFENIGFQHAAPLEGDLNGDGHVDSADLGKLLGGYTG